jgi:predicted MFS family arabinose efflux permease
MTFATLEGADRTEVSDSSKYPAAEPTHSSSKQDETVEAVRSIQADRRADTRSSWRVLSQPDFRLYFLGSLISNLGTWLQSTAQVLIAYQVTHSVFMVGLIASAQFAGMVVSPWAPVLADRFSPRAVLIGTQTFSALIAAVMAWRYYDGLLGVHSLVVGALGLGFAFALALPVQTALVPALVHEEDAADAVKMNSVSYNAGRALAPALCVPVIIFIGPDLIFALNALSFAIFVIILRQMPRIADDTSLRRTLRYMFGRLLRAIAIPPLIVVRSGNLSRTPNVATETSARRPRARVRDGLVIALKRRRLLLLLAIVAAVTFADDPVLVLSPAVTARLHMPSTSAGYFIAALGWGSVLGSLPPTSVRGNNAQHASKRAAISLLVLGASIVVFATGFWFPASLVAAGVAGAAALYTGTAAQAALLRHQQTTGADVATVASVAALWAIAWAGTKPFASLLDGWLAAHIGIVVTAVALTLPAISIALCELKLSENAKRHINNFGERTAFRIIGGLQSSACAESGPGIADVA